MSIQMITSTINRLRRDIASLESQISQEIKNEAILSKRNVDINRSITKSTSVNVLSSKMRQIARNTEDISKIRNKQATISKKIADKRADLSRYEQQLHRELERARKKSEDEQKRKDAETLRNQKKITQELKLQKELLNDIETISEVRPIQGHSESYDVFISHASEDKDDFVRPLAQELVQRGFKVWYDEFSLTWGDSLRRSIDRGLRTSTYGIVVLSSPFMKKHWTQYELDGLLAKEMNGVPTLLPIWHMISKSELLEYSPTLVDKMALNSSTHTIEEIADQLAAKLNIQKP